MCNRVALRMRALELAVQAAKPSSHQGVIVAMAKAFEAYLVDGAVPKATPVPLPKRPRSW